MAQANLGSLHKQASWLNDAENRTSDTIATLTEQRTAAQMDCQEGREQITRLTIAAETLEAQAANPDPAVLLALAASLREGAALEHVQVVRNELADRVLAIEFGFLQGLVSGISRGRKCLSTMARAVSQFFAS